VLVLLASWLGGCGALFGWPPGGTPHELGPVVVLGGGHGDRFALGRELATSPTPRELVLMAGAGRELESAGGSCGDDRVRCVEPEPHNTYGEALAVAALAGEHGWPAVTVVTSEYHVTRTRLIFSYCVDVPTRVVASSSGLGPGTRVEHALREGISTVATLPAVGCPEAPGPG
jgi:uncharacterized SAM-binding protein YcdF (DUF218 family)